MTVSGRLVPRVIIFPLICIKFRRFFVPQSAKIIRIPDESVVSVATGVRFASIPDSICIPGLPNAWAKGLLPVYAIVLIIIISLKSVTYLFHSASLTDPWGAAVS